MQPVNRKRIFDLAVAAPGLVVAAPAIALCWLAVRLDSPGPGLFRQRRIGRDGVAFTCLKLRTMRIDTPDVPTHEVDRCHDTKVGRWLRRSRFDELPQLWNVVIGDMSLVGPRPCLPHQTDLIAARRARGVLDLRPGITGLAQVRGYDMRDPQRLARVDQVYVRSTRIIQDIALIAETLGIRSARRRASSARGTMLAIQGSRGPA